MPDTRKYMTVILPLKIDWEPYYSYAPGSGGEADTGNWLPAVGDRVRVRFAGKDYIGTVSATDVRPDIGTDRIHDIIAHEKDLCPVSEAEIRLWHTVAEYYMCSIGEVYKAAYPAQKISGEEVQARLEARERKRHDKAARKAARQGQPGSHDEGHKDEGHKDEGDMDAIREMAGSIVLSPAQAAAYSRIKESFSARKPALLKGVTGSGKTEIYIKLAAEALESGKNVLYLVPEIALGRQLEYRLKKIFGNRLLVFHSGETVAMRREVAATIRSGNGHVVLGTRSAIFLPHHDMGLVIVDEEHDTSYKQESPAPRYNGRDTAIMLAGIHGCSILLGSATPSLESLQNCLSGKFTLVGLDVRYHESEDAGIEIIDTIAERKKHGMYGDFSLKLTDRIRETLAAGEQVMLFRARRSFSPAVQCSGCGYIPKCPHCNVSLSFHKGRGRGNTGDNMTEGRLTCHYCGYSTRYDGICPQCGGEMRGLGAGTQKIEEEVSQLFPDARVARLDSDTAQSASYGKDVIRKFSRGEIDILIGTQMVTKGFDFPNLSLVAVLQADTLLSVQDFRADERAAQLLEQFRGRCGRRGKKGHFVIQTSSPEHPVYRILSGDGTMSEQDLLQERKAFGYPPYTRVINLCIKDTQEPRAELMGTKLAGILESGDNPYILTGPYSPAVDKVADNHIRIIRLNLRKDRQLAATKRRLMRTIAEFEQKEKYTGHIITDVDPM